MGFFGRGFTMKTLRNVAKIIPFVLFLCLLSAPSAQAAIASCTHGIAVLNNDAQAWSSLNLQARRLHTNIEALRNDLNDLLEMNADIGHADKVAKDIHSVLGKISPLMELVPSIQSGIERTSNAAQVTHSSVLGPVYKITNGVVNATDLQNIVHILDTKVIPKLVLFENKSSDFHLDTAKYTHDFTEACHIIQTAEKLACSAPGSKIIDDTYSGFRTPVTRLTSDVLFAAKAISEVNNLLERDIFPGMHLVLDLDTPMQEIARVIHAIEALVHKLEKDLKKLIHIHVGPVNVKFTVAYLLKEWKKEIRKLEHLLNVDKLKKEMRKEIEKVLHAVEHEMTNLIHKLESHITVHGMDLSGLEAALRRLEPHLDIKGPELNFNFHSPFKELNVCFQ